MAYDGKLLARARGELEKQKAANRAEQLRRQGEVYAALARECPGTTYVSVGHRSTLVKFHQDVIYLDKETQTLRRPSAIPRGREEAGR